jgi:hypothetical protein
MIANDQERIMNGKMEIAKAYDAAIALLRETGRPHST